MKAYAWTGDFQPVTTIEEIVISGKRCLPLVWNFANLTALGLDRLNVQDEPVCRQQVVLSVRHGESTVFRFQ